MLSFLGTRRIRLDLEVSMVQWSGDAFDDLVTFSRSDHGPLCTVP